MICVEAEKEAPVAPYFCDPDRRLEIEVRTCNENPCPPRWNVSDFTACSKSCGGGTQSRGVQCIQVLRAERFMEEIGGKIVENWQHLSKYQLFHSTYVIENSEWPT